MIVSTSNLPAEAQIDVANFSAALFASQITRLSYAQSSLLISLSFSGPARADRIGSRGIPAVEKNVLFPPSSGIRRRCQKYLRRTVIGWQLRRETAED